METTATLYWNAVLCQPTGIALAADWTIDYAQVPLADFCAAYKPFVEALKKEGVDADLLAQLAFDAKRLHAIIQPKRKDVAVRERLRAIGTIFSRDIPAEIYARAVRRVQGTSGYGADGPTKIAEPPPTTYAELVQRMNRDDPQLVKRFKKKLAYFNVATLLKALAIHTSLNELALSQKAVHYLILGFATKPNRQFSSALEHFIFNHQTIFVPTHARALEGLRTYLRDDETRESLDYLLKILKKRRPDLFAAK